MVKQFLLIIGLLFSLQVMSQTGIGTSTPNASAKLDVFSDNKGFLPPRVTLTSATDNSTIPNPAEGLLVYNKGSVGLQAGYYYWNNANWATIATATSSGNGVTSMDMVQLYSKAYSAAIADSTIANATGYKFIVPVSGRYLFDFSCTAFTSQTKFTMSFKVRQGTTDLSTDAQTSSNNSVRVEYNGKLEVNLQAGTTYNVYVTGGSRNSDDYDRVYYKLVAGNLPVTGQSVDYIQASLSANQALSAIGNINFTTSSGTGITITSGGFNLVANKTYKLEAAIGGQSGAYAYYAWVDNSNNLLPGGSIGAVMKAGAAYSDAPQDKAVVYFTPTVDTRVFLRVYNLSGTLTAYAPSLSTNFASTWASIQQVGSSAIINPWTLSGTNTSNTTGNVGIGTSSSNASAILDISSTIKGILIPRMTASQKNAISSPTTGLLIFQTDAPSDFYYYNGSSWMSIREPNWTSAGTIQSVGWNATTTAPTIGTTAVNDYSYKQIGAKTWQCQLIYSAPSNSSGNNGGSGDYLFTLPNGLQFNTSIVGQAINVDNVGASSWIWPSLWLSNSTGAITNSGQAGLLYVVPYSSTQFRLIHVGIAGIGFVIPYGSGYYSVGANLSWRVTFTFQSL